VFERILVPVDFSASSELQVRIARDLARASDGALILLHVRDPFIGPDGLLLPASAIDDGPEFDLQLEAMKLDLVREGGVAVETRCVTGSPVSQIIDLVAEQGVDLIVMGTHGRTGLRHLIMGSVAEHVVRAAPCPVLTIKLARPVPPS
jgi:nucleotide-binding universal stress UspA family protein